MSETGAIERNATELRIEYLIQRSARIQAAIAAVPGVGAGGVTDGDKGDVVVSSSGTDWGVKDEVIDDRVAALVVPGASGRVSVDYDDVTGELAIDVPLPTLTELTDVATALAGKLDDTQKGALNGLAELGSGGLVPPAQLGTGGNSTDYLRKDGTYATPAGGTEATDPGFDGHWMWDDTGGAMVFKTHAQTRAVLDLETGTDLQAYSVSLTAIAAASAAANKSLVRNAADSGFEYRTQKQSATVDIVAPVDGAQGGFRAQWSGILDTVSAKTRAGSATLAVKKNGTAVTGFASPVSLSTTETNTSSGTTFVAGDYVTYHLAAVSGLTNDADSLKGVYVTARVTRTAE